MKRYIWLFALVSHGPLAFATLPPYWDRVSQLNAVIQSTVVAARFGEEIESVRRDDELRFTVVSRSCTMQVMLKPIAASPIGPTTYSVDELGSKVCN